MIFDIPASLLCLQRFLEIGHGLRITLFPIIDREPEAHRSGSIIISCPSFTDGNNGRVLLEFDEVERFLASCLFAAEVKVGVSVLCAARDHAKREDLHCVENVSSGNLDTRQIDASSLADLFLDILGFDVDGTRDVIDYGLYPRNVDGHSLDVCVVFAVRDRADRLDALQWFSNQTRDETRGGGRGRACPDADGRKSDCSAIDKSYGL
jgi:hypothetical protein